MTPPAPTSESSAPAIWCGIAPSSTSAFRVATHLLGDPEQWAERGRREQRLALAPDDPRFGACSGQGLDERSLADAGLAAEQDHAAGGTVLDRVDTAAQSGELAAPLE